MKRQVSIVVAVAALALLVASQLVLPPMAEDRTADRLTSDGGTAEVDIDALPALRLLFDDGDRISVRASGLHLPLTRIDEPVLEDLDGFDEVDVEIRDADAGPFALEALTLARDGDRPYRTAMRGSATAGELGAFAGDQVGGPFGGLLGEVAGEALPFGDEPVPFDLDATIRSEDGRPRAVVVHGTVAGVPAGPLVEALAQALAGSL